MTGKRNLPDTQVQAEKLSREYRQMDLLQKSIALSLLIAGPDANNLSVNVSTGTMMQLFTNCGIVSLTNKKLLNKRVKRLQKIFVDKGRITSAKAMFVRTKELLPTLGGGKPRMQVVWNMNDMGFINVLMDVQGNPDTVIIKNDVVECMRYAERVLNSLDERGYRNLLIDMLSEFDGTFSLSSQQMLDLQKSITHRDGTDLRIKRRELTDRKCSTCGSYEHDSLDCR